MVLKKINKDDTIAQAIEKNPSAGKILFQEGLFCVGCGMAQFETIEQGCKIHGIDTEKVLKKINKLIEKKSTKK